MARVEESTGVPVVCMESPRGVADPSLGAFAEVLSQADCILLLGKRLDFTLKFGRTPAIAGGCEFLQVDPEDDEFARTRRAVGERLLHSTIANVFDAAQAFAEQATPAKSGWRDEVRSAIEFRPAAWEGATSSLAQRLHPVLDAHPDSVFVSDGGEFGQWAQACLRAPHRLINGVAGAIGPALPFAIAARLARPNAPVIAAMGDGTFGFHASEIDTAVRYVLPFLAVVGNDARWNAEHQIQIREYGAARALGTDLVPTRYDEVARGFGGYGELVTEPDALIPSARRALASGLPAVLNVMIEGIAAPGIKR
jgi:acetolactate synthase-1/2/3 large subunit